MSTPSGQSAVPVPHAAPVAAAPRGMTNETVYAAVAKWALRAPHGRLTSWTVGGAVDAVGVALFIPRALPVALAFGCLSCVGAWGLATHRAAQLRAVGGAATFRWRLLSAVRTGAVVLGTLLAVATFYVVMWMVFGTRWGPSGG
jgi:hypothetical protein